MRLAVNRCILGFAWRPADHEVCSPRRFNTAFSSLFKRVDYNVFRTKSLHTLSTVWGMQTDWCGAAGYIQS